MARRLTVRTLYTGPQLDALERRVMDELERDSSGRVDETLYVVSEPDRIPVIEDRWREHGSPLELQVTTLDSFVRECLERAFYETESGYVDGRTRDRLVEVAVERLAGSGNPLAVEGVPARGLCDRAKELLTLVEFAGLLEPDAVHARLQAEGLDRQAEIVSAFHAAFQEVRADHTAARGGVPLSVRAERYRRLTDEHTDLSELVAAPRRVVLDGFTLFSPLERAVVERVVESWPTRAILPRMTRGDVDGGIDRAVERVDRQYREMGLTREWVGSDGGVAADHAALGARLFREHSAAGAEQVVDSVSWVEAPTRPREVRFLARRIRAELDDGRAPGDVGVVLAADGAYRGLVESTFQQYGIPVTSGIDRPVLETPLGRALGDVLQVLRGPRRTTTLVSLLSNPLVDPPCVPDTDRLVTRLRDVDRRTDSGSLERALRELETDSAPGAAPRDGTEEVLAAIDTYGATSLAGLPESTGELFAALGVPGRLSALDAGTRLGRLAELSREEILAAAESVAETAPLLEEPGESVLERFQRALEAVVIERSPDRTAERVVVTSLTAVGTAGFERAYLCGLTDGEFPGDPDRLAFATPINEADEEFEQADTTRRARYHAAVLVADADEVTITTPARGPDGTPLVESDLLAELQRVTGLEPRQVDAPPGSQEDVQREIARLPQAPGEEARRQAVDAAADAGPFDARTRDRAHRGIECAAARRAPAVGPYDGHLSAETRQKLTDADGRAYAPTHLETYASCGFKYYVREVLGIEDPDELTVEATALDRGSFVHSVLERFYRDLQTAPGEAVTAPVDASARHQDRLLEIALDELTDELAADPTPFQLGWLRSVAAGLGDPAENPYYEPPTGGSESAGLLLRYLREEATLDAVTVDPTWFEARVGPERPFDDTVVRAEPVAVETPDGVVELAGTVDRIDTVQREGTLELVVRDYKTGRTPSESATLDGQRFQLPVYALLAEGALGDELEGDIETVGGSYYRASPPVDVSHNTGQIGSRERCSHARSGGGEPLTAWQYPRFDSHAGFREFVETGVPRRLGQLASALESGSFHPTVLDPQDAGCEYCGYSHVCDVRSHQRHDVRRELTGDADASAYIPPSARGETYEPAVEQDGGGE